MKRQKETKAMLEALSVGDEVVTVGGIMGKVTALKDQVVTVEVSAGTEVQLQKGAITTALPKGTLKSA
jgi:preprotein translocase subunit YajC